MVSLNNNVVVGKNRLLYYTKNSYATINLKELMIYIALIF